MSPKYTKARFEMILIELYVLGSGKIDFAEFATMITLHMRDHTTEDEVKLAFSVFDIDGNGFITTQELKQVSARVEFIDSLKTRAFGVVGMEENKNSFEKDEWPTGGEN